MHCATSQKPRLLRRWRRYRPRRREYPELHQERIEVEVAGAAQDLLVLELENRRPPHRKGLAAARGQTRETPLVGAGVHPLGCCPITRGEPRAKFELHVREGREVGLRVTGNRLWTAENRAARDLLVGGVARVERRQ